MTIHTRTGKPLVKGLIECFAKTDVLLNMLDAEDEEQLYTWMQSGGTDVSLVARCLLLASFNPSHSILNMKEGHSK